MEGGSGREEIVRVRGHQETHAADVELRLTIERKAAEELILPLPIRDARHLGPIDMDLTR
jgi:hypothetical protein